MILDRVVEWFFHVLYIILLLFYVSKIFRPVRKRYYKNQMLNSKTIVLNLLLSYIFSCFSVFGQQQPAESEVKTMVLPRVYFPFETKNSFSVLFTHLPIDWVETSIDVPLFQFNNKLGLPAGFTLESSIQSIIVSNQLRAGPHWNIETGKFSFATGIDWALLHGKMEIAGFNNKTWGWCTYPNISAGFQTRDIAFTFSVEYSIINSLKITSGNAEILHSRNFRSGPTFSLFVEQPLWKNHLMVLGFINNFQKFYFPAWPAFSTSNSRYYIPQFYVSLVL